MDSIVFNFTNSGLNQQTEAITLKIAFLLGDRMFAAGSLGRDMHAKSMFSGFHPAREVEMLIKLYQDQPEMHQAMLNMQDCIKKGARIKHKDPRLLAAQKKIEKSIHDHWMQALDNFDKTMDSHGFAVLKSLTGQRIFGCIIINDDPETPWKDGITASQLLQRFILSDDEIGGGDEMKELFFLGSEFLSEAYPKPCLYLPADKQAKDKSNIYLQHIFTLPYVNHLTTGELEHIREQLHTAGTDFRRHTDKWIDQCYGDEDTSDRISFFTNEILPAAAVLQQQINDNSILQHGSLQHPHSSATEVWMGELPVWQLWDYYRHFNAIKDNTWEKLEKAKDHPDYKDKRWPIMMLKGGQPGLTKKPDEEIRGSRKYLFVD